MHMSLGDLISSCHKEIAGSRTKNRLTIQISYAIQLIMDFYSTDFLVMISCGLAIQIPAPEKLFSDFNVASISARRRYSSKYQQIKMDMYSNISVFVALKKTLLEFIESENQNGIDDMVGLFNAVYAKASDCDFVPTCYQDEYYLKTLIMILIYKYCYGGVGT